MGERQWPAKPRSQHRRYGGQNARRDRTPGDPNGPVILYGWHTVTAALTNPARRFRRLLATENALRRLAEDGITPPIAPELVRPGRIGGAADARRRASGTDRRGRSPALARHRGFGDRRHRAGARPDHRSA